jgi:hypothetical protein
VSNELIDVTDIWQEEYPNEEQNAVIIQVFGAIEGVFASD